MSAEASTPGDAIRYSVHPDIVWEGDARDGIRLYNAASGRFHALNKTGSSIWDLAAEGLDPGTIRERLVEAHAGAAAEGELAQRIEREIAQFIGHLVDLQWLEVATAS